MSSCLLEKENNCGCSNVCLLETDKGEGHCARKSVVVGHEVFHWLQGGQFSFY
jgi:hypothetical protein